MLAKKKGKGKGEGAGATVLVVLSTAVKGVGKKGELVKVKPAYAENVILRQGLGVVATPQTLEQIAADEAAAQAAAEAEKATAVELDEKIREAFGEEGCVIEKKVGPDGALFGSVTKTELAAAIKQRAGVALEIRCIKPPALKTAGSATAEITLHKAVMSKLKVTVKPS